MKFFQNLFKRKEKKFLENEGNEGSQTLYAIPIGAQELLDSSKQNSSNVSSKTSPKIAISLEDSKEELAISGTAETERIKEKEPKGKISSESLSQQDEDKKEETSIATLSEKENTKSSKQEEKPISNLAAKPKFSLQTKMMVVITIILSLVVSSIIFLATYFFKSDNKVRILENNLELVRIVELKVRADLNAVVEKGKQLALVINQEFKNPKQKEFFIEQFFKNDDDFIYLALLTKNDDNLIIKKEVFNQNYLQKFALTEEDIKTVINKNFPTFARSFDGASILINTSAGFEEPSLCISIPPQEDSTEKYILVIMLKLQTILDAFGKSGITETFMVSGDGTIIAHPKKEFVLSAKNASDNPIVREMLTNMAMNGLREFELDGKKFLGSYQKLKLKFNNVGIISTVPEDKAFEAVYRIQERNLYIMMISLCSAVIIVILFARTISKPVMKLLQETVKIASGNFQVDIQRTTNDEVGLLSDYFVNMAKGLEEREKVKSILGSMIDPVVVQEAMKDLGALKRGSEKTITAFFSDVAGFSTISEQLSSVDLARLLNEYLSAMTIILQSHGGVLDKYIGDAIVGIFGAPVDLPEHPLKACRASLEMIAKLKELKAYWTKNNLYIKEAQEMDIRIGLNTGPAKVGFMGTDSMGSYTMMGDTVNLAARLEAAGKDYGVNILISQYVKQHIEMEVFTRELDRVRVKGKNEPVTLYEVICLRTEVPPNIREATEAYEEAFHSYLKREWLKAIQFLEFSEKAKGQKDKAVRLLKERCEAYLESPPEENWDGVFTRTHK